MKEAASVEPPEVKTRFATVDDATFEKLLYEKDAKNTRRGRVGVTDMQIVFT